MKIYTCKDRLEDIMTCIYDAWADALLIGHDQIRLKKEPIFQATLLDEYIHVDGDCSKAEKVTRSIRRDISSRAYLYVYYASLSTEEDALQAIYNFLRVGFSMGAGVLENYTNPHVMRIIELYRSVGNESHHFREFARFQSLDGRVYVSHLELFPVEVETASYAELLRVPGVGPKSASRIVNARRYGRMDFTSLKKMGVVLKRAHYFITCGGKQMYHTPLEETYITRQLVSVDRKESWEMAHANEGFSQMTLADFGIG